MYDRYSYPPVMGSILSIETSANGTRAAFCTDSLNRFCLSVVNSFSVMGRETVSFTISFWDDKDEDDEIVVAGSGVGDTDVGGLEDVDEVAGDAGGGDGDAGVEGEAEEGVGGREGEGGKMHVCVRDFYSVLFLCPFSGFSFAMTAFAMQ